MSDDVTQDDAASALTAESGQSAADLDQSAADLDQSAADLDQSHSDAGRRIGGEPVRAGLRRAKRDGCFECALSERGGRDALCRQPGRRQQRRHVLAAGSLVGRRVAWQPRRLLARRRSDLDSQRPTVLALRRRTLAARPLRELDRARGGLPLRLDRLRGVSM
jgi:hypothetical protein